MRNSSHDLGQYDVEDRATARISNHITPAHLGTIETGPSTQTQIELKRD